MDSRRQMICQTMFESSPLGIGEIDLVNKKLIRASHWTYANLGYNKDEFSEMSSNLFESIIHPADRPIQKKAHDELFRDPDLTFSEFCIRLKRKDGRYVNVCIRLSVLEVDKTDQPTILFWVVLDCSEVTELRKQLKDEKSKIDVISYKNNHELRGPVATILGLIQLIDYDGLDGEQSKEVITSLKQTVSKLDRVIQDINYCTY